MDLARIQFDFVVDTQEDLPVFDMLRTGGARVIQMGRYMADPLGYHRRFAALLDDHPGTYDTFHGHDVIRSIPLMAICRRRGLRRRIIHSHTTDYRGSRHFYVRPVAAPVACRLATELVACSATAGKYLFGARPFRIIRNGIAINRYRFDATARARIRARYDLPDDAIVAGNIGRFTFQKNHPLQLRIAAAAAAREPRFRFLLLGGGPDEASIRALAKSLGIAERLIFAGVRDDVADYLSAMDAFLLPSHFEGFGIVLVEAQANGLRSVISDVVPKDALLTPSIDRVALDAAPGHWAEVLLSAARAGRLDSAKQAPILAAAGYDLESEARALTRFYLDDLAL